MSSQDFNFSIKANSQQAQEEFRKLKEMAKELEDMRINIEPNLGEDSTAKMDEYINKATKMYKQFNRTRTTMGRDKLSMGGNPKSSNYQEIQSKLQENDKELLGALDKQRKKVSYIIAKNAKSTGRNFDSSLLPNTNMYRSTSTASERELYHSTTRASELKQERTKYTNVGNISRSTGNMTYAQATRYRKTNENFLYGYQGISREEAERIQQEGGSLPTSEDKVDAKSDRGQALARQREARERILSLREELSKVDLDKNIAKEFGNDAATYTDLERTTMEEQITKELSEQQRILNKNIELVGVLDDAFNEILRERSRMQESMASGQEIYTAPDPNTVAGRISERASATSLAIVGAMGLTLANFFKEGTQVAKSQRPDSQSIGFRTGDYDFRSIRNSAMDNGVNYGVSGAESLKYTSTILGARGQTTAEDLNKASVDAIQFAKLSGADSGTALRLTEQLSKTGTSSNNVQAIQQGVLGAIKASGMQGREEEQIQALNAIIEQSAKGQNVSDAELQSRMAMANVLSATGDRAFQGQNLQDFMSGADETIKGAGKTPFSNVGLLMGMGTNERYMGAEGRLRYIQDTQQGLNSENFDSIANNVLGLAQGDTSVATSWLHGEGLTGDADIYSVKKLLDAYKEGTLDPEEIKSTFGAMQATGKEELDKRDKGYADSPDQQREFNEMAMQKAQSNLSENMIADMFSSAMGTFVGTAMNSLIGSALLAGGKGLLSGLGTGGGAMVWGKMSDMLSKTFKTRFPDFMEGSTGTTSGTGMGSLFRNRFKGFSGKFGADKSDGILKGAKGASTFDDVVKGTTSVADDVAKGTANATDDVAKGAGSWLKGNSATLGKFAKGASYLGVAIDAYQSFGKIAEAENKGEETTAQAGRIGGGILGAKGGATLGGAIGTAILPGIGTALGIGIGGIAGSILGGNVGESGGRLLGQGLFGDSETANATTSSAIGATTINATTVYLNASSLETSNGMGGQYAKGNANNTVNDNVANQALVGNEEQAKVNADLQKEQLRQANVEAETTNLSTWDSLLSRMSDLLNKSVAQNGIIGKSNTGGNILSAFGIGGQAPDQSILANDPTWSKKIASEMAKAKTDKKANNAVNVTTTVNYTGTGNAESDGHALARGINSRFTTEFSRI